MQTEKHLFKGYQLHFKNGYYVLQKVNTTEQGKEYLAEGKTYPNIESLLKGDNTLEDSDDFRELINMLEKEYIALESRAYLLEKERNRKKREKV